MVFILSYGFSIFRFHIKCWPEWDCNIKPRAYRAHALTIELSGRTMRRA